MHANMQDRLPQWTQNLQLGYTTWCVTFCAVATNGAALRVDGGVVKSSF
jgi:hypothetical protein